MSINSVHTHWWITIPDEEIFTSRDRGEKCTSAGSGADGAAFYLDLSSLPRSLSPSPLSGSSSFFPCEHGCLLQVMNASSSAHCLRLDTLKLPQAVARRGKRNSKIACGLGLFFRWLPLHDPALAPLSIFLHSVIPSLPPSLPPLCTRRRGGLLMIILQTPVTSTHTHHFPPQASSLFCFLSSGSHMNNVVPKPKWGQESNGETYCAVKAVSKWPINNQRPRISRCNIVSPPPPCVCVCVIFLLWKVDAAIDYLIN